MSEITQPIPARLRNVAVNGHVAGAADIIDDSLNRTQAVINAMIDEVLGDGGNVAFIDDDDPGQAVVPSFDPESQSVHVTSQVLSEQQKAQVRTNIGLNDVDTRISNAVASEASQRQAQVNGVESEMNTKFQQYDTAIGALNGSDVVVGALPLSGEVNKVYRVPDDPTANKYTDYGWDGTQFVALATYPNDVDDKPTAGSDNLVKSGGVYDNTIPVISSESIIESAALRLGYSKVQTSNVTTLGNKIADNITLYQGVRYNIKLSIPSALSDNLLTKYCDNNGTQISVGLTIAKGATVAQGTFTPQATYYGASIQLRNSIAATVTAEISIGGSVDAELDACYKFNDTPIVLSSSTTDYDLTTIRTGRWVVLEAPEGYTFSQMPTFENTGIRVYGTRRWILMTIPASHAGFTSFSILYILKRVGISSLSNWYFGHSNYSDHTIMWQTMDSPEMGRNYNNNIIMHGDSIMGGFMDAIDNSNRKYSDYNLVNVAIAGSSIAHGGGTEPNLWKSLVDRSKSDNADYIDVSTAKKLIIWTGINDKEHDIPFGEDGTTNETTIEGAMRVAVSNFLTVNPTLHICFITPNNNPYFNGVNGIGKTLEDYAEEIKDVCKKLNVECFDLYHCSCITEQNKESVFNRVVGDHTHPNNDWHRNVAASYIMRIAST